MNSYLGQACPERFARHILTHSENYFLITPYALKFSLSFWWYRFHWLYYIAEGWVVKALFESYTAGIGTL